MKSLEQYNREKDAPAYLKVISLLLKYSLPEAAYKDVSKTKTLLQQWDLPFQKVSNI